MILGFCRDVNEICALLGCFAADSGFFGEFANRSFISGHFKNDFGLLPR
jgi:hypothetical protein